MPIRVVKVFVAICPICKKRVSCTGEFAWDAWSTREELHTALEELTDPAETWDERIAYSCGSICYSTYLEKRRRARFKPVEIKGKPASETIIEERR